MREMINTGDKSYVSLVLHMTERAHLVCRKQDTFCSLSVKERLKDESG